MLARQPLPPGGFWEDLCFLTQQASELAIKAVYQVHGWIFPFVHNLGVSLDGLERQGFKSPRMCRTPINSASTPFRPLSGLPAPITQAEFEESLRIAEAVLRLGGVARSLIRAPRSDPLL